MTASKLTCFRCSLFGVPATGGVKDDYTAARPVVNASTCMPAIRFFDRPMGEMAAQGRWKFHSTPRALPDHTYRNSRSDRLRRNAPKYRKQGIDRRVRAAQNCISKLSENKTVPN